LHYNESELTQFIFYNSGIKMITPLWNYYYKDNT